MVKSLNRKRIDYLIYRMYSKQFKNYIQRQGFVNVKADGEDAYLYRWHQLTNRVETYSCRFFSHYIDCVADIVPEDNGHTIIEHKLNPKRYRAFYQVKALYHSTIGIEAVPKTIVCRISGDVITGSDYQPISENEFKKAVNRYERLILKPSVDSDSGKGVMLFSRDSNGFSFVKDLCVRLSYDYLLGYGTDFVLQEAIEQHADIARFCSSSVNTLRIAVYRSVKDNRPHIIASFMRIGREGEFVDNAHSGGYFIGINIETGKLGKHVCDQYGNTSDTWNATDFSKADYFVPNWYEVKRFVESIADRLHLMHLITFDITVDKDGCPKMIEYNINGYSFWLFMYNGQAPLGTYTYEIIEYCKSDKQKQ